MMRPMAKLQTLANPQQVSGGKKKLEKKRKKKGTPWEMLRGVQYTSFLPCHVHRRQNPYR